MQTLILPGFSIKNKDWAEEMKRQLDNVSETKVVYWPHWETGLTEDNWIEKEAEKIINSYQGEPINLLVKSVGTMAAMAVLQRNPEMVNKLILCGIPINDFLPGNEKYYEMLKTFPAANVLCIQNREDNHGSYDQVERLVHAINPAINILSKERQDHEYPYPEDFVNFLESN